MGYFRAGFTEILGVDHRPQPRYPFPFLQADALEFLAGVHAGDFELIHASPPCQAYSRCLQPAARARHPDLLAPTRAALLSTGVPWVIENVPGAPVLYHITLCGTMFGLQTYRHRRFETSWLCLQPPHPRHERPATGNGVNRRRKELFFKGYFATVTGNGGSHWGPKAMGIDWMTGVELSQAVPPAYTEYVARRFLEGSLSPDLLPPSPAPPR